MKLSWLTAALFLLTVLTVGVWADVAPDKGYKRVSVRIILETSDDLAEYRLFLVSSNLVKEVFLKKGEKTTIDPLGGGARYSSGTIVAIPRTALSSFGADLTGDKLTEFETEVSGYKVPGTIKLLTHGFAREVREADAAKVTDASYRVEKTSDGVTAVPLTGVSTNPDVSLGITDISKPANISGWAMIAGGILMSLAFVIAGLWVFLRFIKKSA